MLAEGKPHHFCPDVTHQCYKFLQVITLPAVPVYTLVSILSTFILLSSSPSSPTLQLQLNEIDSTRDVFLNSVLLWIYHLLHLIWVMINNGITIIMLDIGDGLHTSYRCHTIVCYVTNFIMISWKGIHIAMHSFIAKSIGVLLSQATVIPILTLYGWLHKKVIIMCFICYMHSLHQY